MLKTTASAAVAALAMVFMLATSATAQITTGPVPPTAKFVWEPPTNISTITEVLTFEPRLYRAAFLPALLALIVAAFSLEARPAPLPQTLAAPTCNKTSSSPISGRGSSRNSTACGCRSYCKTPVMISVIDESSA